MRIEHAGDTLQIFAVKELDAATATSFQDAVKEALSGSIRQIEVDLSSTLFVDSCGLGALVALRKLVGGRPGAFRLLNPPPSVQQMLELTRLYRLVEVVRREDITPTQG